MTIFLCNVCGTSYPDGADPPAECRICMDERQHVPATGQSWTTREALAGQHRNAWKQHNEGMFSLQPQPHFAIGHLTEGDADLCRQPLPGWHGAALGGGVGKAWVGDLHCG